MKPCLKKHKHEYMVWQRGFDDLPVERVTFPTWGALKKYINNLGCECCAFAPRLVKMVGGRLYEYGYQGSFRVIGCVAPNPDESIT